MDLLVRVRMHQPHVTRVISRWVILVEDDLMSFDSFPIGKHFPAHRAAKALLGC
jgi:hypothetical protein